MKRGKTFTRKRPRRSPAFRRALGVVLALGLVLVAASGAWAYREVTRRPDPAAIPLDNAQIPVPDSELLSEWLPPDAAVYVRVAFNPALATLLGQGLSGLGFASMAEAMPYAPYILPGLHAMTGYPLVVDAIGTPGEEQGFQAMYNLESPETGAHLMAILDQASREAAVALYPPPMGSRVPMGITLVARVKDPAAAAQSLRALERLLGPRVTESLRLEGDRLSMSNVRRWERGLRGHGEFKRAIAHLPEDRFATMYVDAYRLRDLKAAYEQFLAGGGELGAMLLAPMAGMVADPAMASFLARVEREGGSHQHLALAATNRLGMVQGFTYSDWEPADPEGLRQEAARILQAGSTRGYESVLSMVTGQSAARQAEVSPDERAQFLKELMSP